MDVCHATKANGEPCTLPATGSQGLCWAHAPENADRRSRAASKAAKAKGNRELRTLKASLQDLIGRVEVGELEPTPANTMLRGYSVLIDLIKLERQVYLEEDLDARIEAVESALEEKRGARLTRWRGA
jgi:hypothetical protein